MDTVNHIKRIVAQFGLFCCLLFWSKFSDAQSGADTLHISGDFKEATITQFITSVQNQTKLRFYYDSTQFDSVRITLSVSNQSLSNVLRGAFANTNIYFSADKHNHVFISRNLKVQTDLATDFFNTPNKYGKQLQDTLLADYEQGASRKDTVALENKLFVIGDKKSANTIGKITIAGYIRDSKTGEPINGASVYAEDLKTGVLTDQFGF
jgi:hypothetical protein